MKMQNATLKSTNPTMDCTSKFNGMNSSLTNCVLGSCVYFIKDPNQDPNNAYFSDVCMVPHRKTSIEHEKTHDIATKIVEFSQEMFKYSLNFRTLHSDRKIITRHICSHESSVNSKCYKQNRHYLERFLHAIHEPTNKLLQYLVYTPNILKKLELYWKTQAKQHIRTGNKYEQAKLHALAGKEYTEAREHTLAGDAYERVGLHALAEREYTKSGKHTLAGDSYRQAGLHDMARNAYRRAGYEYTKEGQSTTLYSIAGYKYRYAGEVYTKAEEHTLAGEAYGAEGDSYKAIEDSLETDAYVKSGHAYFKAEKYTEAVKAYTTAGLHALAEDAHIAEGDSCTIMGQYFAAKLKYDEAYSAYINASDFQQANKASRKKEEADALLKQEVDYIRENFKQKFNDKQAGNHPGINSLSKQAICVYFLSHSDCNGAHFSHNTCHIYEAHIAKYRTQFYVVVQVVQSSQEIFEYLGNLRTLHSERTIKVCHIVSHGNSSGAELYNENGKKHHFGVDSEVKHLTQLCETGGSIVLEWCDAGKPTKGNLNVMTTIAKLNPNINVFGSDRDIFSSVVTISSEGVEKITTRNRDNSTESMLVMRYDPNDPNSLVPKTQ